MLCVAFSEEEAIGREILRLLTHFFVGCFSKIFRRHNEGRRCSFLPRQRSPRI